MEDKEISSNLTANILSLYASIFLSSVPFGILAALNSIKMEHYVHDDVLISFCAIAQMLAGIVASRYLPGIARVVGGNKTMYYATALAALTTILMYHYYGYFAWMIVTFIFGAAIFSFSVTRQTMIIAIAPTKHKAILVSIGGMFMSIGNALGPVILGFIGYKGFLPYIIAMLFYFSSIIPIILVHERDISVREEKRIGLLRYIYNSPKIMFAGFSFSFIQSSINAFLIIFGIKSGMLENQASMMFSVLLFGTIFSLPMGYLTDLINRRLIIICSTVASLICAILILLNNDLQSIYALLFLMYGFMIGIKLPAVILINEKYKPTQRLAVNAAFSKFCFIGNICGIFCTGAIMDIVGPVGLWISVILVLFSYLCFSICNYVHKFLKHNFEFSGFFVKNNIANDL